MQFIKYLYISAFFFILLSFLLPHKLFFWQELHQAIAAVLGSLLLATYSILSQKKIKVDLIHYYLLLLVVVISFHLFLARDYFAYTFIGIVYLSSFFFSYTFASNNRTIALNYIFITLTAVCLASITMQIQQASGDWINYTQWILEYDHENSNRAYANIGQPNILGSIYCTLTATAILNYIYRKITLSTCIALSFPIEIGLSLSQSKTSILILIILSSLLFIKQKNRKFKYSSLLLLKMSISILVINIFITKSANAISNITSTTAISSSTESRFEIWRIAIDSIAASPVLGYGFFNGGIAGFNQAAKDAPSFSALVSQFHSIILDYAIWFGIPLGSILIIIPFFYLSKKIIDYKKNYNSGIVISLPLIIHSTLEYPLYYGNTIALFGVLLGLSSTGNRKIIRNKIFTMYLVIIFIICLFIAKELTSLEEYQINQKLYFSNINGANIQKINNIYMMDIPESFIHQLGHKKFENLKPSDFQEMERFSRHYSIPRNYEYIIKNKIIHEDFEAVDLWRKVQKKNFSHSFIFDSVEKPNN